MQIKSKVNDVQLGNIGEGKAYGFEDVAMAAHVLSSNIYTYTRRQEAVLRELTTNAEDSHKDAGKANQPIHVHLPTHAEPYLIVEDFGVGLFVHEVEVLMGTYFKSLSSSRKNNNGFFGVGSKSPFAYSSMFTVEAFKDGQHCLCQCYKDEEDRPRISRLKVGTTDRQNGLIMTVPVESEDIDTFFNEAIKLYQHTASVPVFSGKDATAEILALKAETQKNVTMSGKGWSYTRITRSEQTHFNAAYNHKNYNSLVIGGVSYPLDFEAMEKSNYNTLSDIKLATMCGLVLELDIGKTPVNLDTGREVLQYTEVTCRAIEKSIRAIVVHIRKKFDKISSNMTDWQRMEYMNDQMSGNLIYTLGMKKIHKDHFEFKDLHLGGLEIKHLSIDTNMRMNTKRLVFKTNRDSRKKEIDCISPTRRLHVVVKTSRTLNRDVLSTYMFDQQCSILVIERPGSKVASLDDARNLISQLGNPSVVSEAMINDAAEQRKCEHQRMIDQAKALPLLEKIREMKPTYGRSTRAAEIKASVLYQELKAATEAGTPIYYHLKTSQRASECPPDSYVFVASELGLLPHFRSDHFTGLISIEPKTLELLGAYPCLVNMASVLGEISRDKTHPLFKRLVTVLSKQIIGHQHGLYNSLRLDHYGQVETFAKDLFGKDAWKFKTAKRLIKLRKNCAEARDHHNEIDMHWKSKPAYKLAIDRVQRLKSYAKKLVTRMDQYPLLQVMSFDVKKPVDADVLKGSVRDYIKMIDFQMAS
ncbi:MAG: hypothetical protein RSD49_06785 [Hafnia sp.]